MYRQQKFYGHGKLLLSGEYFVLHGALGLALPTTVGQSLSIDYHPSYTPHLHWKSYDCLGSVWFEAKYEFWRFDIIEVAEKDRERAVFLQNILRQARKQNSHFLREDSSVLAQAHLEFPLGWGLGTSSTLIYNLSQWAYVSPFEMQFKTLGGSGYDIACAQSSSPIFYRKREEIPEWASIDFHPPFTDRLYFVHLEKKQSTAHSLSYYKEKVVLKSLSPLLIDDVSALSESMARVTSLRDFDDLLLEHEKLVSSYLELPRVKELYFSDYWGEMKSLGAWGGDFILATSNRLFIETKEYFQKKGFPVCLPYCELIRHTKGK